MAYQSEIFEQHHRDYCNRIAEVDLESVREKLGLESDNGQTVVPFFENRFFINSSGITDPEGNRPDYMSFVVLAKYILLAPEEQVDDPVWASFKEFKRESHFTNTNFFLTDTEKAIEKEFTGSLDALVKAGLILGGVIDKTEKSYDLAMTFQALPRISLKMLFNDGDEEFPAKCTVLFQRHSEFYLDPESIAMTSATLAKKLKKLHV